MFPGTATYSFDYFHQADLNKLPGASLLYRRRFIYFLLEVLLYSFQFEGKALHSSGHSPSGHLH